jgi:prolyl oligopeptidase
LRPPQAPAGQSLTYPVTRRDHIVDTYYGTTVADPYRWLEHLESPETLSWVDSQRR